MKQNHMIHDYYHLFYNYLFHRIYNRLSVLLVATAIHIRGFEITNLNPLLLRQMENKQRFSPVDMEGSIWDEGGKTEIVQILISHDEDSINAIQFVYVVNGKLVRSKIHGKVTSQTGFAAVGFDYPNEYLVSVSGQHREFSRDLASITFGTNKRSYGPFGSGGGPDDSCKKFAYYFSPKTSFGGFHGCVRGGDGTGSLKLSIGVYIRPIEYLLKL